MLKQRSQLYIVMFVIFVLFLLRFPFIDNPPFERYEMWRQSDTEAMALNFLEQKFNIFYPQLNYDGPAPNYVQLEFQITTFIIAILYSIFGHHHELARLVPVIFFIGSTVFLYLITKKYYGWRAAVIAMLLYGLYPLNLFFSRAIMPESAALFFFIGAFYYFDKWIDNERGKYLLGATVFAALAIASKVPAIFVGVPMLVMAIVKYRISIFKVWKLYFFAFFSLFLPFVYFYWLGQISDDKFVSGIASNHIMPKIGTALFSEEAVTFYTTKVPESLTWVGISIFFIGLILVNWKKEYPIGVWALAMIVEVFIIVSVIRFNYYLVFITPVMAILSGKLLASIGKTKLGLIAVAIFLIGFGTWNFTNVLPRYEINDNILGQAEIVKQVTDKDDFLLIGTLGPELLNASERKGWRFHLPNDKGDLELAVERLREYIDEGAMYFVPAGGYILGDEGGRFKNHLETNYEKIGPEPFTIYKLQ